MKFFTYIKESFGELRHIKWTSRSETITYTISVIVIAFVVAYYLGLFDLIFTKILGLII